MNLGDGLKLETELLDGKTKLILSPYEHKSKISVKIGNKTKIAKCPLRTKQSGHILKSTQNSIRSEKPLQKKTSQAKSEKNKMMLSPTKDFCKQYTDKDCLHIQKEISPATPHIQKLENTPDTSLVAKEKPCKKHIIAENINNNLVCLTQDQLRQILMTVNQGNGFVSLTENGEEEETSQDNLHLQNIPNQPKDENVMGLVQKTEAVSCIQDENKSVFSKNQEASKPYEQKIVIENEWKPADIFSTLGERERDRNLLEAKRAQWRKELDEQVALKKKEKEASEKWNNPWKKSESDKVAWEKFQIPNQSRESVLLEHSFSAVKQEQQNKWIEELKKQTENDQQRKTGEKIMYSKLTQKHPEYFCVSPDTQKLADVSNAYTLTPGSQVESSEEEHIAKPLSNVAVANSQKTNFLRSMTALLDPAQIEERDRRRQKQLEHQKAITAQVEEKRRKKQLEEEQRRKEEQEEDQRLAQEREQMQKQYEEDILKQKQKEETMTLKTNELFQKMQRAQELAQRLKQEQRIRELAQKGHDTSRLIKNLGVDTMQVDYKACTNIPNSRYDADEIGVKMNTCVNSPIASPKKDTGVQTDNVNTGICTNVESHCGSVIEREIINCSSPEISSEFNGQFTTKNDKEEVSQDRGANLENGNSWCNNQFIRTEMQTKLMKKCPKRLDWNINKPLKRYVPASEKYPKELQKQREEKKVRRQMELLHLVERNNPEHLSQNRGTSPEILHSSHPEAESKIRWLPVKEEAALKIHSFSKERLQSSPVPAVKNRTQQTQTNTLYLPLRKSSYERETLIAEGGQTELSSGMSEPSHFIPYVRTNEIYYLDPDAPLSRPSTQDTQFQNPHDCDQEQRQLFDSAHVRDPLLNPNLVKNRDRQQAILKGLSELRQGLLQKQKELETNLMPLAANQEENFSSSF
ncbi:coiled-coil domain-containing protein 66 isoform X2 [Castor canadensis]|uniref:Coiled-coil domain-containing protein 66 isoform X2 n=1 Tax=Castor canadensis TaxID=51338 RepID=A0AC58K568_CASCN